MFEYLHATLKAYTRHELYLSDIRKFSVRAHGRRDEVNCAKLRKLCDVNRAIIRICAPPDTVHNTLRIEINKKLFQNFSILVLITCNINKITLHYSDKSKS